jgi:hypothetical protein
MTNAELAELLENHVAYPDFDLEDHCKELAQELRISLSAFNGAYDPMIDIREIME